MRFRSKVVLGGMVLSVAAWSACSPERKFKDDEPKAGTGGGAGRGGSAGSGGKAGKGGSGGTTGGTSAGRGGAGGTAGSSGTAGAAASGGDSGAGQAGSAGTGGAGGTTTDQAGNGGEAGDVTPPTNVCTGGTQQPCGECGERTCDPDSQTWGDCLGDGRKETCWETEAGVALPGPQPQTVKGNCALGEKTCGGTGTWGACIGAVAPAAQDSCTQAGDDANCNGMPNDTCACQENDTRDCGIDTGNCQKGTQTCTNLTWGACAGEITKKPADSCATTGDDANCNGTPNDTCECTSDAPAVCDDGIACKTDTCQNGVCAHALLSGYCFIGGNCVPHNQIDPTNPCRRCDTTVRTDGWTNSPNGTACDDGVWCNGNDTCNGSGTCNHEFPTGLRCTGTGACDYTSCDEQRKNCFRPNTYACKTTTEMSCVSTACGGDVQSRTVTQYCSGSASSCNGTSTPGAWAVSNACDNNQTCNASNGNCDATLGCGSTWCDSASGLCWMTTDATPNSTQSGGAAVCSNLQLAGRSDWRLPTLAEWLTVGRGCDGTTGTKKAESFKSTCRLVSGTPTDCTTCPGNEGPGVNGCYWPTAMGVCNSTVYSYWTNTLYAGTYYYDISFSSAFVFQYVASQSQQIRCVLTK